MRICEIENEIAVGLPILIAAENRIGVPHRVRTKKTSPSISSVSMSASFSVLMKAPHVSATV